MEIYNIIFAQLVSKFEEIRDTMKKGIDQLNNAELNYRPNHESNTIANLVVHIEGNIKQRIGTGICGYQDEDQEIMNLAGNYIYRKKTC